MKKIIITGNVGKDAEMRADQSGNQFVTFSVGISVGTKQNPKTDWAEVSCNGKLADIAKNYVKKGIKVLIEGFPTVTAYMSRDNKPVASLRIFASNLELLSRRDEQNEGGDYHKDEQVYSLPDAHDNATGGAQESNALTSDSIPF